MRQTPEWAIHCARLSHVVGTLTCIRKSVAEGTFPGSGSNGSRMGIWDIKRRKHGLLSLRNRLRALRVAFPTEGIVILGPRADR